MTTCAWITSGVACTNTTTNLVCDACQPHKQKLYLQYKVEELRISNALSNEEIRGDTYEVLKVINRLQNVIELRNLFTSHLQPSVRDYGHEFHVLKLYDTVTQYQAYLKEIWNRPREIIIKEEEEVQDVDKPTQTACLIKMQEVVNQVVADPFADFEEDIKAYKLLQSDMNATWWHLSQLLEFTDQDMRYVYSYVMEIAGNVAEAYKGLSAMIKGAVLSRLVPVKPRTGDLFPETIQFIAKLLYNNFGTFDNAIYWIRFIIPKLLQVNTYKLITGVEKVDKSYIVVIRHYINGCLEMGLGVQWFGGERYTYRLIQSKVVD